MFLRSVTLRGPRAELVDGVSPAAVIGAWTISKGTDKQWRLVGVKVSANPFRCRARRLLLSVPRAGGFWTFEVQDLEIGDHSITARLGPPLQG